MRIRLLRAFFTLTTLAVVWLVASPALAASVPMTRAPMTSVPAASAPMSMLSSPVDESVPPTYRAPLCDPRGATTFAPPPQMQDVEVSLDTGLTLDDCAKSSASREGHRAAPGRAPAPLDANASSDAAVITAVATLAAAARELLPVPVASTLCPRPGVRSTVDRPPRA
ncbi:MAG TPA: hypothetical protein VLT33_06560 [Labilithrix sp.]|nr:hypothetical protein [Labilithrix sp.]